MTPVSLMLRNANNNMDHETVIIFQITLIWHLTSSEIWKLVYPPRYASTDSPAESVDADNVSLPHSDANSEVGFRENLDGADHTGSGDDTMISPYGVA